jgi:hypothetical protein
MDYNRHVDIKDPNNLITYPEEGIDTCLKAFKKTANRLKDHDFLGTRDDKQEGRPYVWKTWG